MSRVRPLLLSLLLAGLLPLGCTEAPPVREAATDVSREWFKDTVLASDKLVIANFTATWCGYCQILKGYLHRLEKDYGDRIKVVSIDVDEHPALKAQFGIGSIPHMILFSKGEILVNPGAGSPQTYEAVKELVLPWVPEKKETAAR